MKNYALLKLLWRSTLKVFMNGYKKNSLKLMKMKNNGAYLWGIFISTSWIFVSNRKAKKPSACIISTELQQMWSVEWSLKSLVMKTLTTVDDNGFFHLQSSTQLLLLHQNIFLRPLKLVRDDDFGTRVQCSDTFTLEYNYK